MEQSVQKLRRSESCKFRAKFALLVIIPNWLEVGFRNPQTEQPDTGVEQRFGWFGISYASARNWNFVRSFDHKALEQGKIPILHARLVYGVTNSGLQVERAARWL